MLYLYVGSSNILLACGQQRMHKLKCPQCIRLTSLITILRGPQGPRNNSFQNIKDISSFTFITNLGNTKVTCQLPSEDRLKPQNRSGTKIKRLAMREYGILKSWLSGNNLLLIGKISTTHY
jgi:hypothetical protein